VSGIGELKSFLLLRHRLTRFLELLPVRRVVQRLVAFCERLFGVALLHEHTTPGLQGIGLVRTLLVGELKLRRRAYEVPVVAN
jgi:hypothetical protein